MNKLKIGIDNSCIDYSFIDILKELKILSQNGDIAVFMVSKTRRELKKWGKNNNEEIIRLVNLFIKQVYWGGFVPNNLADDETINYLDEIRGFDSDSAKKIFLRLKSILLKNGYYGKKSKNNYVDIKILSEHIARKTNIFLSNDNIHLTNKNEIENEFPQIKIFKLDSECISKINEILSQNKNTY